MSPTAKLVYDALAEEPSLVKDLVKSTGKKTDSVKEGIGELSRAGMVDGDGEEGKAHTYWRTDLPTRDSYRGSRVGQNGLKPGHGPLVQFAVEQLGLPPSSLPKASTLLPWT